MKLKLTIIGLTLFFLSCNCRKQASRAPEETYISLERTACFGTCPIDVYTLYINGHQRYEGKKFTRLSGEFTADMTQKEACRLFGKWNRVEWESYDSLYPSGYSDLPSTIIRYQSPNVRHQIEISGEHPAALDSLISHLSSLRDRQGWKSVHLQ